MGPEPFDTSRKQFEIVQKTFSIVFCVMFFFGANPKMSETSPDRTFGSRSLRKEKTAINLDKNCYHINFMSEADGLDILKCSNSHANGVQRAKK